MRNCHVRRLAIQAPDASAAARGALLVEDALRTASLPGESSRLLIVRGLHIGAIPAGANATAVSRSIEAALAQLPTQAVAAADPAAASAAAVYFADEVEACVQLALLGAAGQPPDAWFWPRAVTGWRNGYDAAYAVRCALGAAARQSSSPDAGAHAVVRVVGGLLASGLLDTALATLEPEDGPVLLRLCGWRPLVPRAEAAARPAQQRPVSPHRAPPHRALTHQNSLRLAAWAATWGAAEARTLWLAAALLAAEQPARASDSTLAEQAAAAVELVSTLPAAYTSANKTSAVKAVAQRPVQRGEAAVGVHSAPESSFSVEPAPPLPGAQVSSSAEPPPEAQASGPAEAAHAALLWWRGLPLRPTEAGGLWLMIPVLARLGIAAWFQEHPDEADLPWRILAELARIAETPPLDPIWAILRHETETGMGFGGDSFTAASGVVSAYSHAPTHDANQAVTWWCDQVQAWCGSLSELSVAAIVRRRGWLYTTGTHIDVFFDLARADLRIRRLGLDVDPGWLPWLRRVVTFYYEAKIAG